MDTADLTIMYERLDDFPLIFAKDKRLALTAVLDEIRLAHGVKPASASCVFK